jgi:hypothetical protein
MLVTKQQIIELALSSLGINSSILDIQPEESALALKKLDLLAAQLLGDGYLFTYVVPDSLGDSTLNDEFAKEYGMRVHKDKGSGRLFAADLKGNKIM